MPIYTSNRAEIYKQFSCDCNQVAGTYDLCTASGGDVVLELHSIYASAAVTGLTSLSIQTNDTTVEILLTSVEGLLAALTGGKNIVFAFAKKITLPAGKKITYTIVGTGTGGTVKANLKIAATPGLGKLI